MCWAGESRGAAAWGEAGLPGPHPFSGVRCYGMKCRRIAPGLSPLPPAGGSKAASGQTGQRLGLPRWSLTGRADLGVSRYSGFSPHKISRQTGLSPQDAGTFLVLRSSHTMTLRALTELVTHEFHTWEMQLAALPTCVPRQQTHL